MRDSQHPEVMLVGIPEVVEGAVAYIKSRETIRNQGQWDSKRIEHVQGRLCHILSEARSSLSNWSGDDVCSCDDMEEMLTGLNATMSCHGLPYASLLCRHPELELSFQGMMSLAHRLATAAHIWLRQLVYHAAKPGKSRIEFDGYRALALVCVEGRGLEEFSALCARGYDFGFRF